ncbi:hypothetical protein SPRG_19741 [Saprolegnia parasitica CBS 223.65]|uniref:DUF1279 domain-containing protein n=1 Tax=Saprolegnia parasitica (strain CBS 223.65) TaxID=695850 RepID=A0A067CH87_SAPPC|nr:hypothetical protein SPRG_19741 [Saprolegnia parasitica CBS 223.65]KDO29863.1 hypothetical protein SPRG_19741 [Saprolegnia parasitica CBS 223.65]|eukprot:XP_012199560.1 hypothetical protein SPRG_19741 [Saprolegnia parasitica CBS 223.65]
MALARPTHFANPILRFCSSGSTIKPSAVAKPTSFGRFKDLWKQYGLVAVGTYLTIYGIVLGSMYAAIETGVLSTKKEVPRKEGDEASHDDGESSLNILTATNRMMDWTNAIGLGQYLDIPEVNSKTSAFLIAWPLRFAVTLMVTPRVARIIRRYRA